MSKRRSDSTKGAKNEPEPTKKCRSMGEEKTSGALFSGRKMYLHMAAISKKRAEIFSRGIENNGGNLVKALTKCDNGTLILVENLLITGSTLDGVVQKLRTETKSRCKIIGLSWLSACLDKSACVGEQKYVLFDPDTCQETKEVPVELEKKITDGNNDSSNSERNVEPGPSRETKTQLQVNQVKSNLADKYVCSQASADRSAAYPNKVITDELQKLADAYKNSNDSWRSFGYIKAISAIKAHPRAIQTYEEAAAIRGVGSKMADKIMEILEEGKLRKVDAVCNSEKMKTISLFVGVWGAGAVTAETWYNMGYRTLEDLKTAKLSKHQEVGLRLYEDLNQRMPREEATQIHEYVTKIAHDLNPGLEVVACGSYRRGKETCGDLDLLISHPDGKGHDGIFYPLLERLHKTKFLTDDLTIQHDENQYKYLGVCRLPGERSLHRRLDIIVVPWSERACALLYFTGSAHCNRSMRALAGKMGMHLSHNGLWTNVFREGKIRLSEGTLLNTPTEESVFEHLGLQYREPEQRDH